MKLPIRLRQLGPDDAADYLALREEAVFDPGYGVAGQVSQALSPLMLAQALAPSSNSHILGAFLDQEMPGIVGFGGNSTGQATLFGLYVRKTSRRHSIGRRLVAEVIQRATAAGYELIKLDVKPDNTTAISLYKSMRFRPSGQDNDTLTMSLYLD